MRILIIHQHDPAIHHVGGVGTYINTFIKYAPQDFKIRLIGVSTDAQKRPVGKWQKFQVNGTAFDYLPLVEAHPTYHGRFPLSVSFTWELWRKRHQIDFRDSILELHRIEPELALRDVEGGCKVLFFHTHSQDLYNPKTEIFWKRFPWLYFELEKRLISKIDQFYTVREDLIDWYQKRYPTLSQPFTFIPTWVDEKVFISRPESERVQIKKELASQNGLEASSAWVLFVGRFELQKDPFLLLQSFQHLLCRNPGTQLMMIGGGSLTSLVRSFITENRLEKNIFIFDAKSQEEVAQWMNTADALCLTSAYEGMPRVILEALQCGLPVVTIDEGEIRRIVTSPGVGRLVKERSPEVFSENLIQLLEQPPNRSACQKAAEPFTAKKVLDQLFASYRKLYAGGGSVYVR